MLTLGMFHCHWLYSNYRSFLFTDFNRTSKRDFLHQVEGEITTLWSLTWECPMRTVLTLMALTCSAQLIETNAIPAKTISFYMKKKNAICKPFSLMKGRNVINKLTVNLFKFKDIYQLLMCFNTQRSWRVSWWTHLLKKSTTLYTHTPIDCGNEVKICSRSF